MTLASQPSALYNPAIMKTGPDSNKYDDAAAAIFARYSGRLVALARAHISDRLAQRIDGEDVVQSVFRTFFRRAAEGEFAIDESVDLWRLLSSITLRKVRSKAREHGAMKRSFSNEDKPIALDSVATRMPTPEDTLILVELLESLVADVGDTHREILALRLAGHSQSEIAKRQAISRQTVNRIIGGFKSQLMNLTADG